MATTPKETLNPGSPAADGIEPLPANLNNNEETAPASPTEPLGLPPTSPTVALLPPPMENSTTALDRHARLVDASVAPGGEEPPSADQEDAADRTVRALDME
jgi:hypothetical protein